MVALLPRAVAGDLLRSELEHLAIVRKPERPLLAIVGGAKISGKLGVLEALAAHADAVCIGGAMSYTFLAAQGEPVGKSLVEPSQLDAARRVLRSAQERGRRFLLPTDHVVAERVEAGAATRVVRQIPDGWLGVDIGPETAQAYAQEVRSARTVFWNGPLGVFEIAAFARGTETLARAVAASDAISVVGGGDSLAAIHRLGLADRITHLSTGGGASLEFIEGLTLPGVAALER
jgi:phosphoglycerate kinase